MAQFRTPMTDRLMHQRTLDRWQGVAARADTADTRELQNLRRRARELRDVLDTVVGQADTRLDLALVTDTPTMTGTRADWVWRPDAWRLPARPAGMTEPASGAQMVPGARIYHDCPLCQITLRQQRTPHATGAPFAWQADIYGFQGGYLSFVIDLPQDVALSLTRRQILRVDTQITMERPVEAFVRLNIRSGPNTDQLVREVDTCAPAGFVDFDLAYASFNEDRVTDAWVEVIFDAPAMNRIDVTDLWLSRQPRAAL